MKTTLTFCFCLLLLPTSSLAQKPASAPVSSQGHVIVTLSPLSSLLTMLLPDVQNQCLLSASADPHHFQPSPRQVDALNQGRLLVRASSDDRGWPIRVQHSVVLDLWQHENHAWLRFDMVEQALPKLATALQQQFPQQQAIIQQNLALALKKITAMQQQWQPTLKKLRQRGVFMQHPAWQGLMESMDVPIWSILESHQHGREHGPHHLEEALRTFKQHPNAMLLGSSRHSNRSLAWLQQHQQGAAPMVKLDALGTCNQPWDTLMQANLEILQENL